MRLLYTPEAVRQLKGIRSYISREFKNPSAGKDIQDGIKADCRLLTSFPDMGKPVCLADGH